jgi:hypothetical protein
LKLHYVYISIGILTLVLNLVLTLHLIRKRKDIRHKSALDYDDIVTFRLGLENSNGDNTTEALPYDDTVALQ